MRNSKWLREEIIIALSLYFDQERGTISQNNPKVIKVSEELNKLASKTIKNDPEKFRNPNGVALKLANFLAIDTKHSGSGMKGYSKLDLEIFRQYENNLQALKKESEKIKEGILNKNS